jgi:glycosyltransferase involved in cell wall biosynthesis
MSFDLHSSVNVRLKNRNRLAILMPDLKGGGAERVAVNLANSFVDLGYAVDMVLLSAEGAFLADLNPAIGIVDLHSRRLRWAVIPIVSYLRQVQPSALLACMWPLTVIALWGRWLARVSTRVVLAEHTTWSRDPIVRSAVGSWKVRATMRFAFPQADGVVAVSQGAADDLALFAGLDRNAINVIYNPVVGKEMPTSSSPLEPAGWWSGAHRRVLAVGNLSPIKDYTTMLSAFAQLRERVNARLLILGEGNCRSSIEAQAKQLGIENSLFMPGFVKNPSPYYQRADLHVLSSTGEGFGNVIVEALAAGTPVVSTDCPSGPSEILCNGKFGHLVPMGDAATFSAQMEQCLASTHDHLALKLRAQDFSIYKAVGQYEDILFPKLDRD